MTDAPRIMRTPDEVYGDTFDDDEVEAVLEESLQPRSQNQLMYDLVSSFGLPAGATALDVGAREGRYSLELARRFGFVVQGVDPVRRHLDNAAAALAAEEPSLAARVRVDEGVAEDLPVADATIDLIWCRDVLVHVADLEKAFSEFRRVLKPGGHAVIYQMTATDWLTPAEAAFLWPPAGIHASSVDPSRLEAAIASAGLTIDQCHQLHGEARERQEEDGLGTTSRQLLQASRMIRNRPAYEARLGTITYEYLLTDNLWGIYQMIGKLNPRVYVLSA
jgi:SAM-dependent methyltransferase